MVTCSRELAGTPTAHAPPSSLVLKMASADEEAPRRRGKEPYTV